MDELHCPGLPRKATRIMCSTSLKGAAYEEGYDRMVKLFLDRGNHFKGVDSETLTEGLWSFSHRDPGNDKVECILRPYCPADWWENLES